MQVSKTYIKTKSCKCCRLSILSVSFFNFALLLISDVVTTYALKGKEAWYEFRWISSPVWKLLSFLTKRCKTFPKQIRFQIESLKLNERKKQFWKTKITEVIFCNNNIKKRKKWNQLYKVFTLKIPNFKLHSKDKVLC